MAGERPGGVTLIAVLTWINGAIGIVTGIIALMGGAGTAGWIALALGVVTLAVGIGLLRGSNVARVIATIVFVLNIVNTILVFIPGVQPGANIWSALGTGLLSLIGLIMLYTSRANEFFRA